MDDGFKLFVCYLESDLRAQLADIISYAQTAVFMEREQRREYESTIVASKASILIACVLNAIVKTREENYRV